MPEYHAVSGSAAEDLFIELFSDAFGAEKAGFLYAQSNCMIWKLHIQNQSPRSAQGKGYNVGIVHVA